MNKGILKSRIMIGMIITLAVGAAAMLGLSLCICIFLARSQGMAFDFSNLGFLDEKLQHTNTILYWMAFGNLFIAAEKIVPLIASILMYKKYPKETGLNLLKIVAVIGAVFYSLAFAVLFVWAFIAAFQSADGHRMETFKSVIKLAIVLFFPAIKFVSLSMTVSSVKKNVSQGILLHIISTAVLTVANFLLAADMLLQNGNYDIININAGVMFLILASENLFLFFMTRKYLLMKTDEKNKNSDDEKKEKA